MKSNTLLLIGGVAVLGAAMWAMSKNKKEEATTTSEPSGEPEKPKAIAPMITPEPVKTITAAQVIQATNNSGVAPVQIAVPNSPTPLVVTASKPLPEKSTTNAIAPSSSGLKSAAVMKNIITVKSAGKKLSLMGLYYN